MQYWISTLQRIKNLTSYELYNIAKNTNNANINKKRINSTPKIIVPINKQNYKYYYNLFFMTF